MNLIIDTERVKELGLTINTYLTLATAYYQEVGIVLDYSSDPETLRELEEQMYIKVTPKGAVLREKGWRLFEAPKTDLFDKFLSLYPVSVPSDGGKRSTAPVPTSTWASTVRRTWNIITNNNISLQEEIINKLTYDVNEKTRTGKLMYMPKIDNWLEKKTWENITIESFINPYEKSI
jgi:hypothetical protein